MANSLEIGAARIATGSRTQRSQCVSKRLAGNLHQTVERLSKLQNQIDGCCSGQRKQQQATYDDGVGLGKQAETDEDEESAKR